LVVQAALFASFLSTFLIELLGRLEPDPMVTIQDILIYQTQMMHNSSLGPYVPVDFSPPEYIVVVNALFYASLGIMLLAAFISMLIKSWVREFDRGLRAMSIPEQRAKTHEFRYLGMEHWKLPEMVAILPLLIQISLLLFSIGLILFLFYISKPSFSIITVIFGVGILYYAVTTSISVFVTSSPFRSPLSRTLAKLYRHAHAHFDPGIDLFLSRYMDTTPATALGRVRRDIQIIFRKSRPYLERQFVEPISATTMDQAQLSTADSALQRIHDYAPNSEHSETLQVSVWQVAVSSTLHIPKLFNPPSWILDRWSDEEYFSHLPPAMVVALVAVWLRAPRELEMGRMSEMLAVLRRLNNPEFTLASLVIAVVEDCRPPRYIMPNEPNHLTKIIRRGNLHRDYSLWLLNTLAELHLSDFRIEVLGICLEILLDDAPKRDRDNPPDIVLLEAVVTLAAMSCSPDMAYRLKILTRNREHPWLLVNLRNPCLISTMFEGTHSSHHKQLTSFLFMVVYALMRRGSYPLANQYLNFITAEGDLPLYISALTSVALSMNEYVVSAIGRTLLVPRRQKLTSIRNFVARLDELFTNYDHQLGASRYPDPAFVAIVMMSLKNPNLYEGPKLQNLNLELQNPWLRLAAGVVAQLDIPDGSGLRVGLFHDHRVHNMIAAMSLVRYAEGTVTLYRETLLASFFESREHVISSLALGYYMKTVRPHSDITI